MQLNVKIDDEIYKVAKREAKAEDVRLRNWVENAMGAAIQKKYAARLESLKEIESSLPPRSMEMTGAKLMGIWNEGDRITDGATGGKDDCAPPSEAHIKARGKKKVRGDKKHAMSAKELATLATEPTDTPVMKKRLRQYAKEAVGSVRPKIDIARLLP